MSTYMPPLGGPRTSRNVSLRGKFLGSADDCANHTPAAPLAKPIFFNPAEPINSPFIARSE